MMKILWETSRRGVGLSVVYFEGKVVIRRNEKGKEPKWFKLTRVDVLTRAALEKEFKGVV